MKSDLAQISAHESCVEAVAVAGKGSTAGMVSGLGWLGPRWCGCSEQ